MSNNRLTDADKWKDTWFSNLSPYAKLLFIFLCDNCNNAGVFEINKKFILFYTGLSEENLKSAIDEIKKTYVKSHDGNRIWIKNYLKYQKKTPLNPNNNNHKHVIVLLKDCLSDEKKFKGCQEMQSLLPFESFEKTRKKSVRQLDITEATEQTTTTDIPNSNARKFIKPTVEEVQEFMKEISFVAWQNEGVRFFNWFESNGWKVGKNPMKDWRSAVRTWMSNWNERNKISKTKLDIIQDAHESLDGVDWNKVYGTENV